MRGLNVILRQTAGNFKLGLWVGAGAAVEGHGGDGGGDMAAADVDVYLRAPLSDGHGNEAHADVEVEGRGTAPAGDLADDLPFVEDGLAVPGNAPGVHDETGEPAVGALVFHLNQSFLAGEGAGGQVNETAQARLEGVDGGVHVVAVEAEAGFEAEAVPGDEAAGGDTRKQRGGPRWGWRIRR